MNPELAGPMAAAVARPAVADAGGWRTLRFRCCDSDWTLAAQGPDAAHALGVARATALRLEARLDAFDTRSDVHTLNTTGAVDSWPVARVVERAIEMEARTGGVFSFRQGAIEHSVKDHLRGGPEPSPMSPAPNHVTVSGDRVHAQRPLDLNGIAKGWMADQVHAALQAHGASGFVNAGGDIAGRAGRVVIEAPGGGGLATLRTPWNIATSGTSRRRRGDVSHLYDPRTGTVGAAQQQVTVVAQRDCTEADVMATVLCVLPPLEALAMAQQWPHLEALFVSKDRVWWTPGFEDHVES